MPDAGDLRDRYAREYASATRPGHFDKTLAEEVDRRASLLTRLAGRAPGRLLDVGCGDGRFLDAAKRFGWTTVGSEIAYPAAALVSSVHLTLVGELDAVREQPVFDAVTFWDVLEHLPNPRLALRQARIRLQEGGLVAVTMPNLLGTASRFTGPHWSYYGFAEYGHIHHLGPKHIRLLFKAAGFDPIYGETRGSVDLRDLPAMFGLASPSAWGRWFLDKASGLVARVAEPVGLGNTLLVVARKTGSSH
jgi:SAM-dependent methyltransferase